MDQARVNSVSGGSRWFRSFSVVRNTGKGHNCILLPQRSFLVKMVHKFALFRAKMSRNRVSTVQSRCLSVDQARELIMNSNSDDKNDYHVEISTDDDFQPSEADSTCSQHKFCNST